jgi:hypothetical protein
MARWICSGLACLLGLTGLIGSVAGTPGVALADSEGSTVNEVAGLKLDVRCKTEGSTNVEVVEIVCELTVENIGSEEFQAPLSEWYILDAEDGYYARSRSALEDAGKYEQRLLLSAAVAPGATLSGYMAFKVPARASGPLDFLLVKSTVDSNQRSVFRTQPDNELIVPLELEPWGAPETRATVHVLETQVSDLKTRTAPTPTITPTPTNTPIPTATRTPTNTPIPPTSTPSRDEATIAALQTEIASLESGTPAATETPVPVPTATPAKTATSKATSASSYPGTVAKLIREDSASRCDRIGWNSWDEFGDYVADAESSVEHYAACGRDIGYTVGCIISTISDSYIAPSAGTVWVLCEVFAYNGGDDSVLVSPVDFTLVDANNRHYEIDFTALTMVDADEVFPTGSLLPEQSVSGYIAFEVRSSAARPLRIEIEPFLDSSSSSKPSVVILDPLGIQGALGTTNETAVKPAA